MQRPYMICTPPFCKSNGVRVLHLLYKQLEKRGMDVYLYCPVQNQPDYKYIEYDMQLDYLKEEGIVIYPEVVSGNPLNFKRVVRYVLYYPGKLGGDKEYDKGEMIFTHDRMFTLLGDVLTVPYVDTTLFYDDKRPKTQDCYFVYKGGKWRDAPETRGLTEINMSWPEKREELAELLRSTGTLYSYDDCTSLLEEAALCGCKPKIITETGTRDYIPTYPHVLTDFEKQMDRFIEVTQKGVSNQ